MTNSKYHFDILKFVVLVLLGNALPSAQASPGADVPWTTYEAESMTNNGTILGPQYAANTVEAESSGRKCVKLSSAGQYVEFTALAVANAIVVRYSVPDSAGGTGIDSTLSLYTNGVFVQKLPMTSKYSWLYGWVNGAIPYSNTPQSLPRNFYDEVRLKGLAIQVGDVVRIQKDATDTATYNIIDLVELENIAPPLSPPQPASSWLTVTDSPYNATGNGSTDDTAALQNCINVARSQGKNVWVPAGNYVISADINNLQNITIQGAGMWHTTFVGDPSVYMTSTRRVRFNGGGNNIHFADFAIIGKLNYRNDNEANDGFSEFFGTGSTISRIWVEHTKTGAWIANSSGLVVDGCRFRNTIADGINLCVGVRSSTVTNCTARGTGDDCFAMWPATYTASAYKPGLNVFTHCTAQLPFLANGGAIYGGVSNRIEDCLFKDMPYGCGVLLSGTFPVATNTFSGATVVQRCDLIRCGGYDPNYQWRAAFQFTVENNPITNVILNNLNLIDNVSDGLSVIAPNTLTNVTVSNLYLPNYGLGVSGRHGLWAKSDARGSMTVSNSTVVEYLDASPNFAFNFLNVSTRATPSITGVTASQAITYGTPNVTLTGTVSASVPVYPTNGETVNVTINGSTHNATISGDTGGFSVSFPTASIPASGAAYTITYAYAGDANFNAASNNTNTTLTIDPVTVTVSGGLAADNKVYDGNTNATLSSNNVVLAGVLPADASIVRLVTNGYTANFATPNVGSNIAVAISGLGLGPSGSVASNYTLVQPTTNTASITLATATVILSNLSYTFDGTAKCAAATSTPAGLDVILTYDDSLSCPTNTGSYAVIGTVNNPNYHGGTTGILVVSNAIPPPGLIILANPIILPNGPFQFSFTNTPGAIFTALATTNVSLSLSDWTPLGGITEISPGQFQFTELQVTNIPLRFYRVRSP